MKIMLKALASLLLPAAVLVADSAVASPHERKEDCAANYALYGYTGIALPLNGGTILDTYRNQICYMGEDVTQAAAGYDLSLTSGINGIFTGGKVALIAANKPRYDGEGEPESAIVLLQAEGKTLNRRVLATSAFDADPAISIESFHIGGYDELRNLAYIEAHTGANSSSIFTLDMVALLQGETPKAKFFAYGRVVYVDGHYSGMHWSGSGDVVVSRTKIVEGEGRVEYFLKLSKDGKEICQVSPEYRRDCMK
ncbi:hypothetical protein [Pseudomonas veronii]|uniref:hypothetical protein n=1 Tax=Pseudomonas veronii TaxID=76761 RepID=UPI0015A28199|nr:hypothetical protein [Pseudomonas veronii]NWC56495.1 hypothetical protein [Pseudomonas veronii]